MHVERVAEIVAYANDHQDKFHEATVNLSAEKVERNVRLGANVHSSLDGEEIITVEQDALNNPDVQAELAKLKLPEGATVVVDPWIYGKLQAP